MNAEDFWLQSLVTWQHDKSLSQSAKAMWLKFMLAQIILH